MFSHLHLAFSLEVLYVYIKVGDHSQGLPESSFFNNYYTEVSGMALLLSLDCSTLPLKRTL